MRSKKISDKDVRNFLFHLKKVASEFPPWANNKFWETILMCEHRVVHLRAEGGAHVAFCYSVG